jgi:hypothetical protein
MSDEGTVSISVEVWEKKLALYMAATGKNMREALYEEWPLLMRKIMDFTPPFKSGGRRGASDLSVGRAAVARDIYKTMRPFDPAQIRTKQLQRAVSTRDVAAFNIIASRSKGRMKGDTAIAFSPQVHLSQRNARGRVTGKDRKRVVLGTDAELLKKYVVEVQKRVGYAKSGWLKALLLVGGEAPGYVMAKGTSGGDVIDDHANDDFPSFTAINRTPWRCGKTRANASRRTPTDRGHRRFTTRSCNASGFRGRRQDSTRRKGGHAAKSEWLRQTSQLSLISKVSLNRQRKRS